MNKKVSIIVLIICGFIFSCKAPIQEITELSLIPYPNSLVKNENYFTLNPKSRIIASSQVEQSIAQMLQEHILDQFGQEIKITANGDDNTIEFKLTKNIEKEEGYKLYITKNKIRIEGNSPQGLFYGFVSLIQVFARHDVLPLKIPTFVINDAPRFSWRGLHLDVSRHFFPVSTIKRLIDFMAFHKLNIFHWHLVDGIGWRIQIESRPKLTDIGAWRKVKPGKRPWEDFEVWNEGDQEERYGGFYTQEEVKEVVDYAADKFITVIPEIELPGHSRVVFYCYPELLCEDDKGKKMTGSDVYCAANEESYQLLEDVLDEVLELFPSEYIHIGGDEVNKTNWKNCKHCKRLMSERNYSPEELQSHFVNHFDSYLKDKGRKLIGWHEILEGDLSESSTIMYWGGEKGVDNNLKHGHPTILTTGNILYFDHYQSLSKFEPKAFGGFSPLSKVYNYDPVPDTLDQGRANLILGVQANTWTEYMPNQDILDYRIFPRLAALSEIAWTENQNKDWSRFRGDLIPILQTYEANGIRYAKSAFRPQINIELNPDKSVNLSITTELPSVIHYTLDGSEPSPENSMKYDGELRLDKDSKIQAISYLNHQILTETESHTLQLHKARGQNVNLISKTYGRYHAKGGESLVDLEFGGAKWGNGKWLGVLNNDFEAVVTLDSSVTISEVTLNCVEETGAGIHFPVKLEAWVSEDGQTYKNFGVVKNDHLTSLKTKSETTTRRFKITGIEVEAKYIKVKADYRRIPDKGVFIFADELIIN
jgi:hexosaminidase